MSDAQLTFRQWLQNYLRSTKHPNKAAHSWVIWCDPTHVWRDLLLAASENSTLCLWAEETHELILRQKFQEAAIHPDIIWLPIDQKDIGYFKVYALQAEHIIQISIAAALDEFGVDLRADQIQAVEPILPALALQWLDHPLSLWQKNFSEGEGIAALVDDGAILAILASPGKTLSAWITPDRLAILNRRVVDDFGLPPLYEGQPPAELSAVDVEGWRVRSTAALLVTEADRTLPAHPPGDREKVIQHPASRDRALKLLALWQNKFDQVEAFENLAVRADAITSLQYWAKNLPVLPAPLSSAVVESVRFQMELENLARLASFEELAEYLSRQADPYREHSQGFWGIHAKKRVGWADLVQLAEACQTLKQQAGVEKRWLTVLDATSWFVESGWRVDWIGEQLFKEKEAIPGALIGVRARLRQAYLRHLDRVNTAFADLLSKSKAPLLAGGDPKEWANPYEYAGVQLAKMISPLPKQPVAVIITDACRYDIGCRLVEALNQGEPTRRAEVTPACAPLPTITPLGMTFALPGIAPQVHVQLLDNPVQPWWISAEHFAGNLAEASQRREWLKQNFKVKDQAFLSIDQVVNSDSPEAISSKTLGRLIFVFGAELDDHEGALKPFGLDAVIERYASLIRRLQSGGFNTIFLVTDHGFFHWEPAPDEKDGTKPEGELLWKSRRAVVGRQLKHNTALHVAVPNSDLECCVPRSVNSFKTYGGLGFYHGGLTLQEWIIPVVSVHFPVKGQKIGGVLKPVAQITSLAQRIQVAPEATQVDLFAGQVNENYLSRPVILKVVQLATGKVVFRSKKQVLLEPGGESVALDLMIVPGASASSKSELEMLLLDADDEEVLDHLTVTLQVELDDWA